jgi:hypothetical protein
MTSAQKMPPGPAPKAIGRKLTYAELADRDDKILRLFIGGCSEREISRSVGLTHVRVNQILRRELDATARHRALLRNEALSIHIARLETLIRAVWPAALWGDLKAIDTARKVLESMARVCGIGSAGAVAPAEQDFVDDEVADADELAAYRRQHRRRGGAS